MGDADRGQVPVHKGLDTSLIANEQIRLKAEKAANVAADVEGLKIEMAALKTSVTTLKGKVTTLEKKLRKLEGSKQSSGQKSGKSEQAGSASG